MIASIIIPTRNRSLFLERALNSFSNQSLNCSYYEVLVIDNGSTDSSKEIVNSFRHKIFNLRYFYEAEPGLHVGRHIGFQQARSDIIVYADDDVEALPTWLEAICDSFKKEEIVLVGGKCLPEFEIDPPEWLNAMWKPNAAGERILGYLSLIDLGDAAKLINPFYVFGCNFAIRRSTLFEAGGFHPDGMPQELIHFRGDGESCVSRYIQAKGYNALYNPLASVYHHVPRSRMTREYFSLRAYNQGISDSYTAIRRDNGLDPSPAIIDQKQSGWIDNFYRRVRNKTLTELVDIMLRRVKQFSSDWKSGFINSANQINNSCFDIKMEIQAAYQQGYSFHQDRISQSPELLDWVLRKNYWDYRLPAE